MKNAPLTVTADDAVDLNGWLRSQAGRVDTLRLPYGPRPDPPAYLTGEGLAIWERIMDEMDASNAAVLGHITRRQRDSPKRPSSVPGEPTGMNEILRRAAGRQ